MQTIFNFVFDNFLLIIAGILIWYIYSQYKNLKEKLTKIDSLFTNVLNEYIEKKIIAVKEIIDSIKVEYEDHKEIEAELIRLSTIIDKGVTGTINEKVVTCNAINKYKAPKNIDLEEFPLIEQLNDLGIFNEDDVDAEHDGVSIARREYNALAFRYNETIGGFPINIMAKFLKLPVSYKIFDPPKSSSYELNYEVFEEEEPEINSLTSLNRSVPTKTDDLNELMMKKNIKPQLDRALLTESDKIVSPTLNMKEKEKQYQNEYRR